MRPTTWRVALMTVPGRSQGGEFYVKINFVPRPFSDTDAFRAWVETKRKEGCCIVLSRRVARHTGFESTNLEPLLPETTCR